MTYVMQPPPAQTPRRKLSTGAMVAIVIGAAIVLVCGLCVGGAILTNALDETTTADAAQPAQPNRNKQIGSAPTRFVPTLEPAQTQGNPATLMIPRDLIGVNALIAHDRLAAAGFTNINYASSDPYDTWIIMPENWYVTKVEPGGGSKVKPDQTIVLTCTKKK